MSAFRHVGVGRAFRFVLPRDALITTCEAALADQLDRCELEPALMDEVRTYATSEALSGKPNAERYLQALRVVLGPRAIAWGDGPKGDPYVDTDFVVSPAGPRRLIVAGGPQKSDPSVVLTEAMVGMLDTVLATGLYGRTLADVVERLTARALEGLAGSFGPFEQEGLSDAEGHDRT